MLGGSRGDLLWGRVSLPSFNFFCSMMLPPQSLESLESLISLERNLELLARPEAVGLRFQNLLGPMVQITFPSTSSLLCCPGLQCQLPPTCLLLIFQTESISHGQLSSLFFSVHRHVWVAGLHTQAPCAWTLVAVGLDAWKPTPQSPAGQRHRIVMGN
ncbi:hypothetical protein H1C71_041689 [Ictidomys tridecemlineatus]|nr:hypothetical protein H1C71_041689 [Ictidomys tridecemlineatus]